jgi:hypothetical protein
LKTVSFVPFQFRAKVEPQKWPIGKDDPDPIIPSAPEEDSKPVSAEEAEVSATTAAPAVPAAIAEPEPKVQPEPILVIKICFLQCIRIETIERNR